MLSQRQAYKVVLSLRDSSIPYRKASLGHSSEPMDIFISILSLLGFVALTAGTGLFVAIEFALTSLEKSTIDNHVTTKKDATSRAIQKDYNRLSFVLSGAQLGITITTLATGFLAEPILERWFTPLLHLLGFSEGLTSTLAMILSLTIATILSMVFGELVPKNLAITKPLEVARYVVHPVDTFNFIFTWFIKVMNASANVLVRSLGIEPADELASARSPQELGSLVRLSAAQGELELSTATVINRSLQFGGLTAEAVMTPRSTVDTVEAESTAADLIALAQSTGHSRFPVVQGDMDNTLGIVHVKDALAVPRAQRSTTTVQSFLSPITTIPDSLDGDAVSNEVRASGSQAVLVADEYGGIAGMITTEDVAEEILGEVWDEHDPEDEDQDFLQVGSSWKINGLATIDELEYTLHYSAPEGPYETLAGLIMATLGRIPKVGDEVKLPLSDRPFLDAFESGFSGAWKARVTRMDGRRIERALLTPIPREEAPRSGEAQQTRKDGQ